MQACQGLQSDKTGTICKPYLQGLQEARDRSALLTSLLAAKHAVRR